MITRKERARISIISPVIDNFTGELSEQGERKELLGLEGKKYFAPFPFTGIGKGIYKLESLYESSSLTDLIHFHNMFFDLTLYFLSIGMKFPVY